MIKIVCAAGAALAFLSSAALADYYIVQEKTTKECKIVETKTYRDDLGASSTACGFKTRDEADKQIKVVCKK